MQRDVITLFCALLLSLTAYACDKPAGQIIAREGQIEIRSARGSPWTVTKIPQSLCVNDIINVLERSRATIVLDNNVLLRLDQKTTLTLTQVNLDQPSELSLGEGIVHVLTRFTKRLGITTPFVNALVDGTEFTVAADQQRVHITVAEGRVKAINEQGEQLLPAGTGVQVDRGSAPQRPLVVRPTDAVQWALYYPQIIRLSSVKINSLPENLKPIIGQAQSQADQGQLAAALSTLESIDNARSSQTLSNTYNPLDRVVLWRANLLLGIGRLDEASKLLDNPHANSADVAAVRTLIDVVLNQPEKAALQIQQAFNSNSRSAAIFLAQSYLLQAQLEMDQAIQAATHATQLEPENPLGWLRLAELQLSVSDLEDGKKSAQTAAQLSPILPRAQVLVGFAQLLTGQPEEAFTTLQKAESLDATDPLAHFGKGLILIKQGQISDGRREIEIAVMLDPGNAELRSYLARAYQLEGRDTVATKSLDLAKRLDPKSPTPWYFEGLRKQQQNHPAEAIEDFQQALLRNNNRAIYRPHILLDQDYATRSASLAKAFQDSGMPQLALTTSLQAIQQDPQNSAAYRQLANSYESNPSQETARVSTLLQAQLRQPIGMIPLPPQALIPNVPVLQGLRTLSLQETSALFDQNKPQAIAGVLWGQKDTHAGAIQALLPWQNNALSFGHYHYETDGFRQGADLQLRVTHLLLQSQLAPATQLQLEWRQSDKNSGDVRQKLLDNSAEERVLKNGLDTDIQRAGLHHRVNSQNEILFSLSKGKRTTTLKTQAATDIPFVGTLIVDRATENRIDFQGAETQWLQHHHNWNFNIGVGSYHDHTEQTVLETDSFTFFPAGPTIITVVDPTNTRSKRKYENLYAYIDSHPADQFAILTGASFDKFEISQSTTFAQWNGKLGFAWQPVPAHRLRLAWYQGSKAFAAKEQTLEPAQFNGFTQLYDDANGSRYQRIAVAYDAVLSESMYSGIELGKRILRIPNLGCAIAAGDHACYSHWREKQGRGYVSWRLLRSLTLSVEPEYEKNDLLDPINSFNFPIHTTTRQWPMRLAWQIDSNWGFDLEERYINQTVKITQFNVMSQAHTHFWLTNVGVRYQAGRSLMLGLFANNLFNKHFNFQNTDYLGDPKIPLFQPGRSLFFRARVQW